METQSASGKQLTLAQLLLWLLATAVVLGFEQWRLKVSESDATFRWYFNGRLLFFAPLEGACLASLALCFGKRFPSEPGHWCLVIRGTDYASVTAQEAVNFFIGEAWLNALPAWLSVIYGHSPLVAPAALALFAAGQFQKFWRATFIAIAVNPLTSVLHTLLVINFKGNRWFLDEFSWSLGSRLVYSLPALLAVCAVVNERPSRQDFLHWVGVAVMLLIIAAEWPAWIIWLQLFR
jgi:hypothetical protein